jgi:hypothetical protein
MTTAWANAAQGRWREALEAHVMGTLLAGVALAVAVWLLIIAVRGRRLSWQPGETAIAAASVALAGLVLCEWALRLARP